MLWLTFASDHCWVLIECQETLLGTVLFLVFMVTGSGWVAWQQCQAAFFMVRPAGCRHTQTRRLTVANGILLHSLSAAPAAKPA